MAHFFKKQNVQPIIEQLLNVNGLYPTINVLNELNNNTQTGPRHNKNNIFIQK